MNRIEKWGMAGLAIAVLVVGLSPGVRGDKAKEKPAEKGMTRIISDVLHVSTNRQSLNVYARNPLRPFDSTDWFVECPCIVTAAKYDEKRQILTVAAEHGWGKADSDDLKERLAWKYREAGRPISAKAITLIPLEVVSHQLLLRDGDNEFVVSSTPRVSAMTPQEIVFKVPALVEGANRLHERLSENVASVRLVLRAGYAFNRYAGLSMDRRALSSAWRNVLDKVMPMKAEKAEELLVDRDAEQALREKLSAEVEVVIKTYGLSKEDEKEALAEARKQIAALSVPSAPITPSDLAELADSRFAYTAKGAGLELLPFTKSEAITRLREERESSAKVLKAAEEISDRAKNNSLKTKDFHKAARDLATGLDSAVNIPLVLEGKAKWHLNLKTEELSNKELDEVAASREYLMNKSLYTSDVRTKYKREVDGLLEQKTQIVPLLKMRRVSLADMTAQATAGMTVQRHLGEAVLFKDMPVSLRPTPFTSDVVLEMKRQLDGLTKRLDTANLNFEDLIKRLQSRICKQVHKDGQVDLDTPKLTVPVKDLALSVDVPKGHTQTLLLYGKIGGVRPYLKAGVVGCRFDLVDADTNRVLASTYLDWTDEPREKEGKPVPKAVREATLAYLMENTKGTVNVRIDATPVNAGLHLGLSNGPSCDSTRSLIVIGVR